MDLLPELLKNGVLGLVAAVFFYLYMAERKENKELYQKLLDQSDARRQDAKETVDKVTAPLEGISQTLGYIYDKMIVSKRRSGS